MAVAVRAPMSQEQPSRPALVAADRRPYQCHGARTDVDGRARRCKRRIGDIEGDSTLMVTCERCGQEHEFALRSKTDRDARATIILLLAFIAFISYDDNATP